LATIAAILFSAIIVLAIGLLFYYGEKEPEVSILDNSIQIKAMYGLNVDLSDIDEISFIEKSMNDIGVGRRTNGYDGIGEALKGDFKSDTLGDVLLFVCSKSSPTIKISRFSDKDIYISYKDREKTKKLFNELTLRIPQ